LQRIGFKEFAELSDHVSTRHFNRKATWGKGETMKINRDEFFEGGQFLKAPDVKNGQQFTIEKAEVLKTRIGDSLVLRFKGQEKPFGLNATNFDMMVEKFGDETDDWVDKRIKLNITTAPNPSKGGKEGPALRIA
jgi:hypothetical protein